jgi:Meiotically up-regulated gene 113
MSVYLIRSGDTGPVKIGRASDVEVRRKQLQTSHPEPLRVIRAIEGSHATERWLHDRFAEQRLRGEWFEFHADMLAIEPPAFAPPRAREPKYSGPLVSWAADMCSMQQACSRCVAEGRGAFGSRLAAE